MASVGSSTRMVVFSPSWYTSTSSRSELLAKIIPLVVLTTAVTGWSVA